jgi:glycerol-3-phosphate acyltransferase PlsX
MGGDHAPDVVLDGVFQAVARGFVTAEEVIVVGPESLLRERIATRAIAGGAAAELRIEVVEAPEVVGGDESPVEAMRRKPRSSIAVGIELVREQRAQAFVSAGSTGVVAATASLALGTLEGIRRPGIATIIEGERGPFMLIDIGANPQPKPLHLLQYAMMGSAYFHDTFGTSRPRVALLNIGSEAKKGNSLTREVADLLDQSPINFVGNIEGVELFHGDCEVVVCDGFTGNVVLKVAEGLAEHMMRLMTAVLSESEAGKELVKSVLGKLLPRLDYSEYGGALLLGANGIVTICHGRSSAWAIANALRVAKQAVGAKVNDHIVAMVREASATP